MSLSVLSVCMSLESHTSQSAVDSTSARPVSIVWSPIENHAHSANQTALLHFWTRNKRKVLELKVECTMKERGCDWSGELGKLDMHVDTQNGSCQFVDVSCPNNCGESHQRYHLANHLWVRCPKQPFACKYCKFKATYEQVFNDHYPKCVVYPVPCPNKCEIGTVEQGNLQKHMSECPLQVVKCHLGCSGKMKRAGLPKYI